MIRSTFFHQKKVQVLWPDEAGSLQPALWSVGFAGPVHPESGMIINLKDVLEIQEQFLRQSLQMGPVAWLTQSASFILNSESVCSKLPFVSSLFFLEPKVRLELSSENSNWSLERQEIVELDSELYEVRLRHSLEISNQFLALAQEAWPKRFSSQEQLCRFLSEKGEYVVKPYLKNEGFTSLNY